MKLSTVLAPKYAAATRGTVGAAERNAPMVNTFAPNRVELITWRPGSMSGLDDMRPASFRNATIEPVNVTPPMKS